MKRKLLRQALMLMFFMTATTTLSSFTSPQARGGGDTESYDFIAPYYGGTLDTGLPKTWGYELEMYGNPYWISYNNEDAAADNHLCFRVEFNTNTTSREARFSVMSYENSGRTEYEIYIFQEPWPGQ